MMPRSWDHQVHAARFEIIPSEGSAGRKLLDDTRNTWALVEVNARGVRCPRLWQRLWQRAICESSSLGTSCFLVSKETRTKATILGGSLRKRHTHLWVSFSFSKPNPEIPFAQASETSWSNDMAEKVSRGYAQTLRFCFHPIALLGSLSKTDRAKRKESDEFRKNEVTALSFCFEQLRSCSMERSAFWGGSDWEVEVPRIGLVP